MGDAPQLERHLTIRQASARTGISEESIRDAAIKGDLVTVRFAERGKYWIAESELAAWLERSRHRATPKVDVAALRASMRVTPVKPKRPRTQRSDRHPLADLYRLATSQCSGVRRARPRASPRRRVPANRSDCEAA